MNRIITVCFISVLLFAFSACSLTKTPITADEFSSKVTSWGYTVHDATKQYEGQTLVTLVAIDSTQSYKIEFFEVSTQSQASGAFSQNKTTLDAIGSGTSSSASGKNWAAFSKTAGGSYGYVSYIGNTFIYLRVPEEYKQVVKDVVKDLKY